MMQQRRLRGGSLLGKREKEKRKGRQEREGQQQGREERKGGVGCLRSQGSLKGVKITELTTGFDNLEFIGDCE